MLDFFTSFDLISLATVFFALLCKYMFWKRVERAGSAAGYAEIQSHKLAEENDLSGEDPDYTDTLHSLLGSEFSQLVSFVTAYFFVIWSVSCFLAKKTAWAGPYLYFDNHPLEVLVYAIGIVHGPVFVLWYLRQKISEWKEYWTLLYKSERTRARRLMKLIPEDQQTDIRKQIYHVGYILVPQMFKQVRTLEEAVFESERIIDVYNWYGKGVPEYVREKLTDVENDIIKMKELLRRTTEADRYCRNLLLLIEPTLRSMNLGVASEEDIQKLQKQFDTANRMAKFVLAENFHYQNGPERIRNLEEFDRQVKELCDEQVEMVVTPQE